MSTLDLRYNVDVIVNISKLSVFRNLFDLMCIVGQSHIIPLSERVRTYYTSAEMLADGWTTSDPEYKAALLAFSQPSYPNRVMVGRWDDEAGAVSTVTIHTAGAGYALNDVITIVQVGGSGATAKVTAVDETGGVVAVTMLTRGADYTVATELATTVAPAGGTGCKVNITAIGETAAQAAATIRAIDSEWYVLVMTGIHNDAADILSVATWAESATPSTAYAYTTNLIDVTTSVTTDIFSQIKALGYKRSIGMYCSNSATPDAVAGIMGYAMGQMRGALRNSAFTLNFKSITGATVETLSTTQFNNIVGKNGNVYINRGEFYNWFQNGTMADGSFFDERVYLDKLANDIQLNVADLFNQVPKVPQTEAGVTQIIGAIVPACDQAVRAGFIAPGRWLGQTILNLEYGDTLVNGYLIQAEPIAEQSKADRDARKSPPIYVAVKLAGAIHSVVIRVDVDR